MSQSKNPPPSSALPPADWLTAQARAATTAKPKKPKAAYKRRWQWGTSKPPL